MRHFRRSSAAALAVCFALATLAADPVLADPAVPGVEVPVGLRRDDRPTLSVAIAGETFRFVLDTGLTRSMIAASLAARLALVPRARFAVVTAAGPAREGVCAGPLTVAIGTQPLAIECLGWVPGTRQLEGAPEADGILGADALTSVDLLVDLQRARVRVAPPGTLAAWVEGDAQRVTRIEGRPALAAELGGLGTSPRTARLVIDSGANLTVLFGALAEEAAQRHPRRLRPARLTTAASEVHVAVAPLGRVRAGGVELALRRAALATEVTDREEHGLVPLSALGPVLFDLVGGRVVLGARLREVAARPRAAKAHGPTLASPAAVERARGSAPSLD